MNSYIIHLFCLKNRIEVLKFKALPYAIRKKRGGGKGKVFLTLVKTIQCWHASLTVCIQTKVLSDEVENQLGTNFPQHKFNTHSTS